jgi:hypothetical protein
MHTGLLFFFACCEATLEHQQRNGKGRSWHIARLDAEPNWCTRWPPR